MNDDYDFLSFGNSPEDMYQQQQSVAIQPQTQGLLGSLSGLSGLGQTTNDQLAAQIMQAGQAGLQDAMQGASRVAAQKNSLAQQTSAQAEQAAAQQRAQEQQQGQLLGMALKMLFF